MLFRTLPLLLVAASALAAEPTFIGPTLHQISTPDAIGLANSETAFLLRKSDGALIGLWNSENRNLIATAPVTPLWSIEQTLSRAEKPKLSIPAKDDAISASSTIINGRDGQVTITSTSVGRSVTITASLHENDPLIHWRIEVSLAESEPPLWSVNFPQIAIAAVDDEPEGNQLLVPYRRGQLRTFGKGGPRGDADLPYPGPSAKFQFIAAYGERAKRGFYLSTQDGAGFSKSFITRNYPQSNSVVLAVNHQPADRGRGIRKFALNYDVATGPFKGDWCDAARLYRQWWTQQEWASRGLLANQRDLPQWLLHSVIATRPSTTTAGRTVPNNLIALNALSDAFSDQPFMGIWYGSTERPGGPTSLDEGGHGHLLPPKPGLLDAIRETRSHGVHLENYIQSMIYDANISEPDAAAAEKAVTRDAKRQIVSYGTGERAHLWAMCRATDFWQNRLTELSRRAVVEWGFEGVYLDSFGKGAPECFAPDHGHAIGGGNTVIAGQRAMARKIRAAIQQANPEAIMSGEDPVEAFRDLLDVNLYSVNVMSYYVPIYRTVWGDYSLGHGRVLAPGDAFIPETAVMFLEGTIPGRIYCESPKVFLLQPEHAAEWAFLKSAAAYTEHALSWLRTGEYLHPLALSPALPMIEFKESCEHQPVKLPAVLNSVTRSHADGSVAIALANISNEEQRVEVPIDPGLRGEKLRPKPARLERMDEAGKTTEVKTSDAAWTQQVVLKPAEIAVFLLR